MSQARKDAGFRSALCADVPKADLKKYLSRDLRKLMPEEAQYGYLATIQALEHAKMDQDFLDQHEVGVIYGNDSVAEATMQALDKFRQAGSTAACGSGAIFQSMNSTVTMNLATLLHLRGINVPLVHTLWVWVICSSRMVCRIALSVVVPKRQTCTASLRSMV